MRIHVPLCLLLILVSATSACAAAKNEETVTITTYYPSPYGVYNVIRLHPDTKAEGSECKTGELYYENMGTSTRPTGLYFCNDTERWERLNYKPQFELGGMYQNGEYPSATSTNCPKGPAQNSFTPSRNPCCEHVNPLNNNQCGCPEGYIAVCMDDAIEPQDTDGRDRRDETCYCYKKNF
ncbi:MAG TPA: hypothetical protein P5110_08840 [Candidatus Omnitrophota bacterium]|nr:hypothetical protein [Candidatus Omnitrophota bacterium]HRZ15597.1 hypothetical protein [Candidatus Omnitrophota bacterium]